jgi:hypothetical protein
MASLAGWISQFVIAATSAALAMAPPELVVGTHGKPVEPAFSTHVNVEALPIRELRPGAIFSWVAEEVTRPIRLRSNGVSLTIRTGPSSLGRGLVSPRILIEAPGRPPLQIDGTASSLGFTHMIGVGSLDREGTPFVYYQGFSGGAHCCRVIQVARVEPHAIYHRELGAWDGEPRNVFPRDEDRDGLVDFVQRDDRFRYQFGGGGSSYGPPQVLNIYGGHVLDVSMRPSFRRLFLEEMRDSRRECVSRAPGADPNGPCAAYVAAAARVGLFDRAWAEMLRSHQPDSRIELPEGCRFILTDNQRGPPEAVIQFPTYPDALRHFLRATGYIAS